MDTPFKKAADALAPKVEKVTVTKPAPKAPDVPKYVTAYKEYKDDDAKYMKGEMKVILKRLAPKGMPKRSK